MTKTLTYEDYTNQYTLQIKNGQHKGKRFTEDDFPGVGSTAAKYGCIKLTFAQIDQFGEAEMIFFDKKFPNFLTIIRRLFKI